MADPTPSEEAAATPSDETPRGKSPSDWLPTTTEPSPVPTSPDVDGKAFANTKQHVANRQADGATIERFANTRHNIALINDPKNGPRFTLTKRESGLSDEDATDTEPAARGDDEHSARAESPPSAPWSPPPATGHRQNQAPSLNPTEYEPQPPAGGAPEPTGLPPVAEPPDKVSVDSSKTFVGPNGTYYDESWRWMDWRGTNRSWNWPAALSFGHWFAYRRLYRFAGAHLVWLAGLAAAAVNGVPILILLALAFLATGLAGAYGNILYFQAFRRAVGDITRHGEGSYQELTDQLAKAGGTSISALGWMGGLSILGIAAVLGATFTLRGGLIVSFWPFS